MTMGTSKGLKWAPNAGDWVPATKESAQSCAVVALANAPHCTARTLAPRRRC